MIKLYEMAKIIQDDDFVDWTLDDIFARRIDWPQPLDDPGFRRAYRRARRDAKKQRLTYVDACKP